MDFLRDFVANSAQSTQKGDRIDVTPFKLDSEFKDQPSDFEIVFLEKDVEYHYSISVTTERVISECLLSRHGRKSLSEIFSRRWNKIDYVWNTAGLPNDQAALWKKSTRENALFLSTAIQLNSEEMADVYEWLTQKFRVQGRHSTFSADLTSHLINDHEEDGCKQAILNVIREADLGIRAVKVEESAFDETKLPKEIPDEIRTKILDDLGDSTIYEPKMFHRTRQMETVAFDLDEESDGTQRLYEMLGPFILSMRHSYVLVVDEIELSLHPFIVRLLVSIFQDPEIKSSCAQLIFTTHDAGLLDSGLLERDQIYFVEKRRGQSELIPLQNYGPRKGEALRLNYLSGKYGGIPSIPRLNRSRL
jgi:uncharacterized protein